MRFLALAVAVVCVVPTITDRSDVEDERHLVDISLDFGIKLYKQLAKYDLRNICFSPYTILTSLALVHAGSKGKTRAQIESTLGLQGSFIERADDAIGAQNDDISKRGLDPVLAVFSQSGFAYNDTFVKTAQADYGTSPQLVDFGNPQTARAHINAYVAKRTNGSTGSLVRASAMSGHFRMSSVQMLLVSALSARRAWAVPADQAHAVRRAFFLDIEMPVQLDYVTATPTVRYGRYFNTTVMDIPLDGGRQSLFIIMPDNIRGLTRLAGDLNSELIERALNSMTSRKLDVHLPRFRVLQNFGLREVINQLGITRMFTHGAAELGSVSDNADLYVDQLVHESLLAINRPEAYSPPGDDVIGYDTLVGVPTVKIDRPFFYIVRDTRTNLALFLGQISHPKTEIPVLLDESTSSASSLAKFSTGAMFLLLLFHLYAGI